MKRVLLLALMLASCARYDRNDLELAVAHSAKDTCTCLFVMKQSEEFCAAWVKASPDVPRVTVDREKGLVKARAFTLYGAEAQFYGAHEGCRLK